MDTSSRQQPELWPRLISNISLVWEAIQIMQKRIDVQEKDIDRIALELGPQILPLHLPRPQRKHRGAPGSLSVLSLPTARSGCRFAAFASPLQPCPPPCPRPRVSTRPGVPATMDGWEGADGAWREDMDMGPAWEQHDLLVEHCRAIHPSIHPSITRSTIT